MPIGTGIRAAFKISLAISLLSALTGCTGLRPVSPQIGLSLENPHTSIESLVSELAALGPSVDKEEAQRLAVCAHESSLELAMRYRVARPPAFHNFLVNTGMKQRGLCYHWAEDLWAKLEALNLVTLELNWGMARAGTYREHNCVVVTARGAPFETGIVLDAWRQSGNLVWKHVSSDKYPWVKGELVPTTAPEATTRLSP